ncbi:MAG: DNA cytosine methyltransferase [Lachnospiraceae bacterium]|nr:DNA cytosine methyltransferase [Lachnospiraceae bacterium]
MQYAFNNAAVDIFCGIGGLTHGLQMSGINVVAGIDNDESCRYAYEENNNSIFINEDVSCIVDTFVKNLYPEKSIKILVGCAPCQPFSKYSQRYRKEGVKDKKWYLLDSFLRLILGFYPEVISMENVPEISNVKIFTKFVNILIEHKYNVSWKIVYCPEYGIPQSRRRLVLLASRLGSITLINPYCTRDRYPTVRDAIGNFNPLKDGEFDPNDKFHCCSKLTLQNLERIKNSIPNGTWRDWDSSLQLKCHKKQSGSTYSSVYGRMSWDSPSPTITTQFFGYGNGRFGHPVQNRALSLREGATLQSFPRDYKFFADDDKISFKKAGLHIGNAVPVKLGLAIGDSIIRHLKEIYYGQNGK